LAEIAQHAGCFAHEGLNVKLVNSGGFSAANAASAFLSGQYTFSIGAAPSQVLAVEANGPFKAVMGMDLGQQAQVVISAEAAKKYNIPLNPGPDQTPDQTTALIKALKGTGLSIGLSNTSSNSYNQIAGVFDALGITLGGDAINPKSNPDVVIKALGNTSTLPTAMAAGKVDGFALPPPLSDVKGATVINLGNLEPVHSATGVYMMALNKEIQSKPDTIQKTINAMVLAWQYAHQNPDKAQPMLADMYTANGVKSPSDPEAQQVFKDDLKYWVTPYISQTSFNNVLTLLEKGQGKPVKVTYTQIIDNDFVTKAASDLGITVPTS
jgi:ABC-type nitrate/sulfonate/bicarbonate transport system substrate-binding protein